MGNSDVEWWGKEAPMSSEAVDTVARTNVQFTLSRDNEQAIRLAMRSAEIVLKFDRHGTVVATTPCYPGAIGDGVDPNTAVADLVESVLAAESEYRLHKMPALINSDAPKSAQLNIRVTEQEREMIQQRAAAMGFDGVSEFVRRLALGS
jgi:hypothetical protein